LQKVLSGAGFKSGHKKADIVLSVQQKRVDLKPMTFGWELSKSLLGSKSGSEWIGFPVLRMERVDRDPDSDTDFYKETSEHGYTHC
jgi:hypothetical protein